MDVLEAIRTRKSIRAYKPDPVPHHILEDILKTARQAPSWGNTQCWELAVVTGKKLDELKKGIEAKMRAGVPLYSDVPPPNFSPHHRERAGDVLSLMQEAQGIKREDREKRREWEATMARFFDAPVGIIFCMDRTLGNAILVDIGIIMQSVMLAAHGCGLGTCPEAIVVRYPDVVRQVLGIPESKMLVCGMSLGYPDLSHPVNKFPRPRQPLESLVTWHEG